MTSKKSKPKTRIIDIKTAKHKEVTENDIVKDITWVYKMMGLKKPKIYIADSYKAQKQLVQKYNTKSKSASIEPKYNDKVRNKGLTSDISEDSIEELRERYGNTDENFALDKSTEVLTKNTKDSKSDQFFGAGFELFYSLDPATDKRIFDFYSKGIFNIEYYQKECFICTFPVAMRFDSENRLHGGELPAIEFADGNHYFLVRDVYFDAEMWKKIQGRTMPITEVLGLPNIEQRCVALEFIGPEKILEQCNAKKIHGITAKGNSLYEVALKMGENRWGNESGKFTYKLLQYACPSTDRKYASFVPEDIKDADEAMAWKFSISKEDYLGIKTQA